MAALCSITLIVVAACGDDDDATKSTSADSAATTAAEDTATTTGSDGGSGGDAPETTEAGGDEAPTGTVSAGERTSEDAGEPVKGGTLVYGQEADTANPWAPYRASCATSCRAVLKAISDPLFSEDLDGKPVPYLLESIEHNDDYTEWTMHVRDGIKFHDGEALTGDAVKLNIQSCQYSPLTGAALSAIDQVTASGQDVTITTKGPWVALASYFVDYVPCGFMFSPKWLSSLEDLPQRDPENPGYDATLAATPAGGDALAPVGLGAFKYVSFAPGNGNGMKRCATMPTGGDPTASPVRTCPTSTASSSSSPSTRTAARTRSGRARST